MGDISVLTDALSDADTADCAGEALKRYRGLLET